MTQEIHAKSRVTNEDGQVFIKVPSEDIYLRLTPAAAEQMAGRLFVQAALADGREVPTFIALMDETAAN